MIHPDRRQPEIAIGLNNVGSTKRLCDLDPCAFQIYRTPGLIDVRFEQELFTNAAYRQRAAALPKAMWTFPYVTQIDIERFNRLFFATSSAYDVEVTIFTKNTLTAVWGFYNAVLIRPSVPNGDARDLVFEFRMLRSL